MRLTVCAIVPVVLLLLASWPAAIRAAESAGEAVATRPVTIATLQPRGARKIDPWGKDYAFEKVAPLVRQNLDNIYALFEEAGKQEADLAVAPEDIQGIASYGLHVKTTNPETGENLYLSMIETIPGPITRRLAEIARTYKMNIIAGMYQKVAEGQENRYYNVAVVIDREGKIVGIYRKTHLPSFEKWTLTPGTTYPVFDLDVGKVGIAICYDISFEECPRILALSGADVIVHPTLGKFPLERGLVDAVIYRARAMDNSVHVVTSEFGSTGSGVIDQEGNVVAERFGEENVVVTAKVDLAKEHIDPSAWWKAINGTDNVRARKALERHPETYGLLLDPRPPLLKRYPDVKLVTEPDEISKAHDAIKY
jgi:N-carbamoylputrescine amidase